MVFIKFEKKKNSNSTEQNGYNKSVTIKFLHTTKKQNFGQFWPLTFWCLIV